MDDPIDRAHPRLISSYLTENRRDPWQRYLSFCLLQLFLQSLCLSALIYSFPFVNAYHSLSILQFASVFPHYSSSLAIIIISIASLSSASSIKFFIFSLLFLRLICPLFYFSFSLMPLCYCSFLSLLSGPLHSINTHSKLTECTGTKWLLNIFHCIRLLTPLLRCSLFSAVRMICQMGGCR